MVVFNCARPSVDFLYSLHDEYDGNQDIDDDTRKERKEKKKTFINFIFVFITPRASAHQANCAFLLANLIYLSPGQREISVILSNRMGIVSKIAFSINTFKTPSPIGWSIVLFGGETHRNESIEHKTSEPKAEKRKKKREKIQMKLHRD